MCVTLLWFTMPQLLRNSLRFLESVEFDEKIHTNSMFMWLI